MNRQDVLCILFTSVGLIVAFPPFPMGFIAIVVLVPFFLYLKNKDLWVSFKGGYVVGLLWAGGTLYWIGWATISGLIGVLLFVPLYFALFAVIQGWLWKRLGPLSLWAAPLVWTGIEILSSWGVMGFPWNSLAYTLTYSPILIQYASVTGMYGVTFWVVLLNVVFTFLVQNLGQWRISLRFIFVIVFLFLIPWGYGKWTFSKENMNEPKIGVSLIQGNIDPYKKWTSSFIDSNFVIYRRLTERAREQNPDLIIWPETAAPCYLRHRFTYLNRVKPQIDRSGIPLLTGSPDYEWVDQETVRKYNGALLIQPNSWRIDRYYKIHLVPFSERVPFVDRFPFLYNALMKIDRNIGDFFPGDSIKVFQFIRPRTKEKVHFSVVICYESIFPELVRKFIKRGAQFLVIITNDGWFGKTSGPYQHARIAVLRAIENRVWVARCANTGISKFIDSLGRIRGRTALNEEAVLTDFITLRRNSSFFTNYGYLIHIIVIIMNGLMLLIVFIWKKDHKPGNIKLE